MRHWWKDKHRGDLDIELSSAEQSSVTKLDMMFDCFLGSCQNIVCESLFFLISRFALAHYAMSGKKNFRDSVFKPRFVCSKSVPSSFRHQSNRKPFFWCNAILSPRSLCVPSCWNCDFFSHFFKKCLLLIMLLPHLFGWSLALEQLRNFCALQTTLFRLLCSLLPSSPFSPHMEEQIFCLEGTTKTTAVATATIRYEKQHFKVWRENIKSKEN